MRLVGKFLCFSYSLTKNEILQSFMITMKILNNFINYFRDLVPFRLIVFLSSKTLISIININNF